MTSCWWNNDCTPLRLHCCKPFKAFTPRTGEQNAMVTKTHIQRTISSKSMPLVICWPSMISLDTEKRRNNNRMLQVECNDTQSCCRNDKNLSSKFSPQILLRTEAGRAQWGTPPSCGGSGWHGKLQSSAGLSPSSGVWAKSVSHGASGNWYSVQRPTGNCLGISLFSQHRLALGDPELLIMMLFLTTGMKAMGSVNCGHKLLEPWAKVNLPSLKLVLWSVCHSNVKTDTFAFSTYSLFLLTFSGGNILLHSIKIHFP